MEEQVKVATDAAAQMGVDVEKLTETAYTMMLSYGPKLVLAFVTLVLGLWLINRLVRTTRKHMETKADPTLGSFVGSLSSVALKAMLLIAVASMVGIETTSFIAVLGAAGLAVGLALQGSLSNFAGGVLILLFKPFRVGDVIEAQGFVGSVKEIQIFNTILKTPDNRTIIIPNGALSNGSMINITLEPTRRVDMSFGIGYGDDIDKAREVLRGLITSDARILKDPEYTLVVSALAESSVDFTVRVWVKKEDYWAVFFDMQEKVKKAFDKNGVSIPFPQRDVHLYQAS
jgi:small conductance mechanosensitive channel